MEKHLLLETIAEVKNPIQLLSNIRQEYKDYHTPKIDVTKFPVLLKIFLGYFIFQLIAGVGMVISFANYLIFGILAIMSLFITIYIYITLEEKINLFQIKQKVTKNAARIQAIIQEEQKIVSFLEEKGYPLNYGYPKAVRTFENYLHNYRADSLKECINLFEQEIKHQEHIEELRTVQQIQEMTYNEARSAKNIAFLSFLFRR